MSVLFAILSCAVSGLTLSTAALAHDGHRGPLVLDDRYAGTQTTVEQAGTHQGEWDGAWQGDHRYAGSWDGTYTDTEGRTINAEYDGVFIGESRFVTEDGRTLYRDGQFGWVEDAYENDLASGDPEYLPAHPRPRAGAHGAYVGHHGRSAHRGPRFAYTAEQRAEWLAQCRALRGDGRAYHVREDDDDADGGLIGGLLGAVVGGIAGNRIADGERLAGTLIGAGVGGLAGVAIGSLLDGDDDERDIVYLDDGDTIDYCEAYLINHERGYSVQQTRVTYAPVAMMPVAQPMHTPMHGQHGHQHTAECRQYVHEEVVYEEVVRRPEPEPRIRRTIRPRPHGKLLPLR